MLSAFTSNAKVAMAIVVMKLYFIEGITTLNITTFSKMTLSIMAFSNK